MDVVRAGGAKCFLGTRGKIKLCTTFKKTNENQTYNFSFCCAFESNKHYRQFYMTLKFMSVFILMRFEQVSLKI